MVTGQKILFFRTQVFTNRTLVDKSHHDSCMTIQATPSFQYSFASYTLSLVLPVFRPHLIERLVHCVRCRNDNSIWGPSIDGIWNHSVLAPKCELRISQGAFSQYTKLNARQVRATKKRPESTVAARSWLDWEQARSPRTKYMFNRGAAINYPFVCSRWDRRRCILINCSALIWIKSHHAHISTERLCNKIISINLIENPSVFIASIQHLFTKSRKKLFCRPICSHFTRFKWRECSTEHTISAASRAA